MLKEIWVLICSEFMLWSALHMYSDMLWICILICSLRLYSDPFPETALWSVFWICILNDFLKPLLWPGFWIYVLNWFLTLYSELFPKIVLWICFLKLDYSESFLYLNSEFVFWNWAILNLVLNLYSGLFLNPLSKTVIQFGFWIYILNYFLKLHSEAIFRKLYFEPVSETVLLRKRFEFIYKYRLWFHDI